MPGHSKIITEMQVSTSEMAALLGLSVRRVQDMAREGVLPQDTSGRFPRFHLKESLHAFIRSIEERCQRESKVADIRVEKTLLTREQRIQAELKTRVMTGQLHRGDDVRAIMSDMLAAFRARILVIPSRLAPRVVGLEDIPVVQDLLTAECHEALAELAGYKPEMFHRENPDYVWSEDMIDDQNDNDEPDDGAE